ncbi:metal-dependent hydrolase [Haloarchaeobius sp. HME9146]|uniref:metal-dependent hydrolase n=1 Tax=Haloarchaeobius sp. HME9146 TaxID=2978732 RepID=UPI0021BFECBD|nr:metal-dependent hydrolase [Haloarchaeobius sp. HME9146]MCT9094769.1 metal-dependent hydrolase [Haloarchaeobius sp. HME9146]
MMAMTHALAGLLLATFVVQLGGGDPATVVAAAVAGSVFPDLDIYAGHRKTLHFPVFGWFPAGLAVVLALAIPTTATLALATFLVAAALHPVMDLYGGGLELRPWEGRSEKAVYSHYHGRWLAPRRLVPYDGSPRDLALAGALGVPALTLPEPVPPLVVVTIVVGGVYVALRKRLATVWSQVAQALPPELRHHVPERFYE